MIIDSAKIVIENKNGGENEEYKIRLRPEINERLNSISLRDFLDIKGIGRLGIRTMCYTPHEMSGSYEYWKQGIKLYCYRIDTTIPF